MQASNAAEARVDEMKAENQREHVTENSWREA